MKILNKKQPYLLERVEVSKKLYIESITIYLVEFEFYHLQNEIMDMFEHPNLKSFQEERTFQCPNAHKTSLK